jgi:hypothetical protein
MVAVAGLGWLHHPFSYATAKQERADPSTSPYPFSAHTFWVTHVPRLVCILPFGSPYELMP